MADAVSVVCAVVGCQNSSYEALFWERQNCPKHKILRRECPCSKPFSFFNIPHGDTKFSKWQRKKWFSQIGKEDSDSHVGKAVVCSVHFVHKMPTQRHPYPELLLPPHRQSNLNSVTPTEARSRLSDVFLGSMTRLKPLPVDTKILPPERLQFKASSTGNDGDGLNTPALQSNCLICCNPIRSLVKHSQKLRMDTMMDVCANSICEEMLLDEESISCFTSAGYCLDCYQLVYDVDFLRRTIQGMKLKLEQTVLKIEETILQNFHLGVGVTEEAHQPLKSTPYSEALNHIGKQLDKKKKIKESMAAIGRAAVEKHKMEEVPVITKCVGGYEHPKSDKHIVKVKVPQKRPIVSRQKQQLQKILPNYPKPQTHAPRKQVLPDVRNGDNGSYDVEMDIFTPDVVIKEENPEFYAPNFYVPPQVINNSAQSPFRQAFLLPSASSGPILAIKCSFCLCVFPNAEDLKSHEEMHQRSTSNQTHN